MNPTLERSSPTRSRHCPTILRRLMVVLALTAVLATGAVVATPHRADASVTSCSAGRCTVYLSKSETRALASGRVAAAPQALPWQLKTAYYAVSHGHRWIAQQYSNRGWCSGFRLSVYPWESQGYFGYSCNWN